MLLVLRTYGVEKESVNKIFELIEGLCLPIISGVGIEESGKNNMIKSNSISLGRLCGKGASAVSVRAEWRETTMTL